MLLDGTSYNETVVEDCSRSQEIYTIVRKCSNFGGTGYVIQYNYTALHVTPLYQVLADEAIVRQALNDSSFNIQCSIEPLPIDALENAYGKADDAFLAWFLGKLFIGRACCSFTTLLTSRLFIIVKSFSASRSLQGLLLSL